MHAFKCEENCGYIAWSKNKTINYNYHNIVHGHKVAGMNIAIHAVDASMAISWVIRNNKAEAITRRSCL